MSLKTTAITKAAEDLAFNRDRKQHEVITFATADGAIEITLLQDELDNYSRITGADFLSDTITHIEANGLLAFLKREELL
jgi:hypothetical protein